MLFCNPLWILVFSHSRLTPNPTSPSSTSKCPCVSRARAFPTPCPAWPFLTRFLSSPLSLRRKFYGTNNKSSFPPNSKCNFSNPFRAFKNVFRLIFNIWRRVMRIEVGGPHVATLLLPIFKTWSKALEKEKFVTKKKKKPVKGFLRQFQNCFESIKKFERFGIIEIEGNF